MQNLTQAEGEEEGAKEQDQGRMGQTANCKKEQTTVEHRTNGESGHQRHQTEKSKPDGSRSYVAAVKRSWSDAREVRHEATTSASVQRRVVENDDGSVDTTTDAAACTTTTETPPGGITRTTSNTCVFVRDQTHEKDDREHRCGGRAHQQRDDKEGKEETTHRHAEAVIRQEFKTDEECKEDGVEYVESIPELAELFRSRKGLGGRRVWGICGRVTKGRTPEDFRLLSDEPNKKLSWVVGPDGLERLCGKSPREIMLAIGKDTPWLIRTLKEGYRFKLFLFPAVQARQATWRGVFDLLREVFPEAWPKIEPHTETLPKLTIEDVQKSFHEFDICEAFLHGRDHHQFMTLERYLESSGTLGHTRAFLYHEIGLTHLFRGDGFTRTENGEVGLREYLVINRPLEEFSEYAIVDLPLSCEELEESPLAEEARHHDRS